MGMFDVIRCDAVLPDAGPTEGIQFQTKSFPEPCLQCYVISNTGRLLDILGHDLEPDGYITFYTSEGVAPHGMWREYRARFSSGQLLNIVCVGNDSSDGRQYALASFHWHEAPSLLTGDREANSDLGSSETDSKGAGDDLRKKALNRLVQKVMDGTSLSVTPSIEALLPEAVPGIYSNHQRIDARSLALHCLVARKLLANPALIDQVRSTLSRFRREPTEPVPAYIVEWERILSRSTEEVAYFLASMSEDATRLRQSSPCTGVLTPEERKRVYDGFR